MGCGNKDHFIDRTISHACGICKHWYVEIYFKPVTKEPCVTCKNGDCQWVAN